MNSIKEIDLTWQIVYWMLHQPTWSCIYMLSKEKTHHLSISSSYPSKIEKKKNQTPVHPPLSLSLSCEILSLMWDCEDWLRTSMFWGYSKWWTFPCLFFTRQLCSNASKSHIACYAGQFKAVQFVGHVVGCYICHVLKILCFYINYWIQLAALNWINHKVHKFKSCCLWMTVWWNLWSISIIISCFKLWN